jgi:hypothetical protein
MSFDTTFNYAAFTTAISTGTTRDQASIATAQTEITLLTSAATYASVPAVVSRLSRLNAEVTRLNANITKRGDITAQIQGLVAISQSSKTILYELYNLCGDTAGHFMARMLFNYNTMIADPNVVSLSTDTTSTVSQKSAVAKLIYQQSYPVDTAHSQILMELIRANMQAGRK